MSRDPEAIAQLITGADTIALCGHVNPDGDTLGSTAAMRLALLKMGKKVSVFCDGRVPGNLRFLPGWEAFRVPEGNEGPFDLTLSLDVSGSERLGSCRRLLAVSTHTGQIDHHGTNPGFMDVNSVDGECPACCLMIREQLKVLGVPLDKDIATCLYAGISTDTGNFSFPNTTAECFDVMRELMEHQLPLAELNMILFLDRSLPQVRLIARALTGLTYYRNGSIAVMKLSWKDFEECCALGEHADTIVNFGLYTVGTSMALLARETETGQIKVSLRAKKPYCVDGIAQQFGGGGHPQAAGISMEGTLDETADRVLNAMIQKLDEGQ